MTLWQQSCEFSAFFSLGSGHFLNCFRSYKAKKLRGSSL